MLIKILLNCSFCKVKHNNYGTVRSKGEKDKKLDLKKYCKFCHKTRLHKEEIIK